MLRSPIILVLTLALSTAVAQDRQPKADTIPFEISGKSFIGLKVRDDAAASEWYQRSLGMEQIRHLEDEEGRYSIRILRRAGLAVELIRLRGSAEPPDSHFGLFKSGFYVDDIERTLEWLAALDVDMDVKILEDDALDVRTFVFRDLEGNRIQVFQEVEAGG